MKKKIIHFLCHTLLNDNERDHHVFQTFGSRLAQNINKYTNDYKCEVWFTITGLHEKLIIEKKGIIYKLYPAKTLSKTLESYFAVVDCPSLFEDLKKENPKKTIIHFQGERGNILHTLLSRYSQYKLVLQYHGYGQPVYLDWVERIFITPLEKKNFIKIQHFFVPIKSRVDYLVNAVGIKREKISFENSPIDYSQFKLMDQKKTRQKLEIPCNKFVMLYVGPMTSSKGVDKILKAYEILKQKYPQLYLLFVGVRESDPLYRKAVKVADKLVGRIDHKLLNAYYNVSDVFCFYGNEKTIRFAGPGIALTEALACNVKVISTNLIHFPDEILPQLGLIPKSFNEFLSMLEDVINKRKIQIKTRNIIRPYVSTEHVIRNVLKVYSSII